MEYQGGDEKHSVGVETKQETPFEGLWLLLAPEIDHRCHHKRGEIEKDDQGKKN